MIWNTEPRGALRDVHGCPMSTTAICSLETACRTLCYRCIVEDVLEYSSIVVVWFANFFPAFGTPALEKARYSKRRMQTQWPESAAPEQDLQPLTPTQQLLSVLNRYPGHSFQHSSFISFSEPIPPIQSFHNW